LISIQFAKAFWLLFFKNEQESKSIESDQRQAGEATFSSFPNAIIK